MQDKGRALFQVIYDALIYDHKVKNQSDLATQLGYNEGYISKMLKQTDPLPIKLQLKITEVFGVNKEFLSSNGEKGSMFDTKDGKGRDSKRVPVLGDGLAGTDMELNTDQHYTDEYIDVGDMLRDSEAAFTVYGNSMTPAYPSGCILGLKRNYDGFIQPGETYLIVTKSNRVFKRLYYNKAKDGYICYSDNTMKYETGPMAGEYAYPQFEVMKSEILSLFDITGMIKRNRNSGIIMRQK